MHEKKVLIIDDDSDFLHLASLLFKKEGAQTFTAHDGLDGLIKLFMHHPDLIILDVMMPGPNGFEVCQRIQQVSDTPIIMLTAINNEQGMLRGLESGADVYLSKPFSTMVLLARARAVLRQHGHTKDQTGNTNYEKGHLRIDFEKRYVFVRGKRIKLTPVELRLLGFLIRHEGKVLTHDHILSHVWDKEKQRDVDHVHVYISYLRQKIEENPKDPHYILTVHGVGYIFENGIRTSNRPKGSHKRN